MTSTVDATVVAGDAIEVEPTAPADGSRGAGSWRRRTWSVLVTAACAAITTIVVSTFALQTWDLSLHQPPGLGGDGLFSIEVIKSVTEHGWYLYNPDVGAPFGQDLHDFAVFGGDTFSLLLVKVMGWFAGDPVVVANVYYLATFPLAAISAALVLRAWSVTLPVATAVGTLFAIAPYHFERGFGHLFLSEYFVVPIGAHLALSVLLGRPLFRRPRAGEVAARWGVGRIALTVGLCALTAIGGLYYAVFAIILVAFAGLVAATSGRGVGALAPAAACCCIMGGVLVAAAVPNIAYAHSHGSNEQVGKRQAFESEIYGLKISQMLLPGSRHRISAFAEKRSSYLRKSPIPSEPGQELGTIGAIGFLGLLGFSLARIVGVRRRFVGGELVAGAAVLALLAVLVGTIGGFSALFATLVTPQIRAWNRISIVILFLCLVAVAVAVDRLVVRAARSGGPRRALVLGVAAAALLLVAGYFDQTNPSELASARAAVRADFDDGHAYIDAVDAAMPPRAMIFQLPYVAFPENPPVNDLKDYEHFRTSMYQTDLRWSYGAMRGRPEDWASHLETVDVAELPRMLGAAGFSGLYVDEFGYADRAVELRSKLVPVLGPPSIVSPSGRFEFYDLRAYAHQQQAEMGDPAWRRLGSSVLHPLDISYHGFYGVERTADETWRWMPRRASIEFSPFHGRVRHATVTARVQVGTEESSQLFVLLPGGDRQRLTIRGRRDISFPVTLAPDRVNTIRVRSTAPLVKPSAGDDRALVAQWFGITITEELPHDRPGPATAPRG